MSLLRRFRPRPQEPGSISVRELVEHGLSLRPQAVGIVWPDTQVTVCREHVEDEQTRQMLRAVRPETDTARLLVGDDLAQTMRFLCASRHPDD